MKNKKRSRHSRNGAACKAAYLIVFMWLGLVMASMAWAESVEGVWLNGDRDAAIALSACGDSLCGRIIWLRDPLGPDGRPDIDRHNKNPSRRTAPLCGLPIVGGFLRGDSGQHWKGGWIYDPDSGDTYKATLGLQGDHTLAVRGYVGIPLFGRTEIWTRPEHSPQACAGS